jgi:PQQ-like domain
MRRLASVVAVCLGCAFLWLSAVQGQGRGGGTWSTAGGDPQLSGWQKAEPKLTKDAAKDIKLLWKLKLGSAEVTEPTEPLFGGHTITNNGFKDMAFVLGPSNTLTNLDYELGVILWQKQIEAEGGHASAACPNGQFSAAVIQPAPAFGGGRGRGAAGPAVPAPPPQPPVPVGPRVGAGLSGGGGGGFGGIRGIFVLTADGYLHEQIMTNGWDYGTPVKFISANANLSDPTINGGTMYVNTSGGCGGARNGVWAIDMSTNSYQQSSYATKDINAAGLDGPALSTDGKTLYVATGGGAASSGVYPNGVVALDGKTMAAKDYYTPSGTDAAAKTNINVSPVVFPYKGRDVVAAYGAGGRLVLLDSASLGGADHNTPLAITGPISKNGGSGAWGRLASAEDGKGARWVFVSVRGPLAADIKFPTTNGPALNGSVVAFKIEDQGGKTVLTPEWASPDVMNPSPAVITTTPAIAGAATAFEPAPIVANGPAVMPGALVFVLGEGEAGKSRAKLLALDAATGAQVYSSGDQIESSANAASISVSGGHILFLTSDNTLYGFGIAYERD